MGFILKYCDVCQRRIPEDDFLSGTAMEWQHRTYCKDHVPDEVRNAVSTSAGSRTATRLTATSGANPAVKRGTTMKLTVPQTPSGSGARASGATGKVQTPPSGRMDPRGMANSPAGGGTSRRRSEVNMEPELAQKGRNTLIIGAVVAGCVVLVLGVLIASGGGGGRDQSGTGSMRGNTSPNKNDSQAPKGPSPEELAQKKAESDLKEIEAAVAAEMKMLTDFSNSHPDKTDRTAYTTAEEAFDRVMKLQNRLMLLPETVTLSKKAKNDLNELVDGWAEFASQRFVSDIIARVEGMCDDYRYAEARQLLEAVVNGEREELYPKKFVREINPLVQLRKRLDEVKQGEQETAHLSEAQRQAEKEFQKLTKRGKAAETADYALESSWREVDDVLKSGARLVSSQVIANDRFQALARPLLDVTYNWLAAEVKTLEQNNTTAVNRWIERGTWYCQRTNPQSQNHQTIQRALSELKNPTQNPPTSTGKPGGIGAPLAEAQKAAADKSLDFNGLIRPQIRLASFIDQFKISEAAQKKADETYAALEKRMFAMLKEQNARIGKDVEKPAWRARALAFIEAFKTNDKFKADISQLNKLYDAGGATTTEDLAALEQLFADFDLDSRFGATLWQQRANMVTLGFKLRQTNETDQNLLALMQRGSTWCFRDWNSRLNGISSRQELDRVRRECDWLLAVPMAPTPADDPVKARVLDIKRQIEAVYTRPEGPPPALNSGEPEDK